MPKYTRTQKKYTSTIFGCAIKIWWFAHKKSGNEAEIKTIIK